MSAHVPVAPASSSSQGLPPGPNLPPWRQLWRFAGDPIGLLDECGARFGDAFTLDVAGNGKFVMLSDPEAVREVFRGDPAALHSGDANAIFKASVGENSVLVLDEAPHARQRRVLVPPLKGDRMRAFFDAMRRETLDAVAAWPEGRPFPSLPVMRRITLRVILRSALGLEPGPDLDRFEHKVEAVLANGRQKYALVMMTVLPIERFAGSRWVPMFRQLSALDDDLFALMAARRRGEGAPGGANVLDDLIASTHEDGTPATDREIRDALITVLIAGHETTALALSWALVDILGTPEAAGRIADELTRVTGGGPPEADHLAGLEYLDAAIRESLRMSTVVPFVVRKTMRPVTVAGRDYPAGVILCPCAHLVHRRPDLYPEPDRFRPERFLERKFGPHEWLPFGGGIRVCAGMPFALYEMKVVLATIFGRCRLERPAGARSRPRRYGLVLGPDDGGRIVARRIEAGSA